MSDQLNWDNTEKPEPIQQRTQQQPSYGGNSNKTDYYNTTDYEAARPDKGSFKTRERYCTIYSEIEVPESVLLTADITIKRLKDKGFAFRGHGADKTNLEEFIVSSVGGRNVDIHSPFKNLKRDIGVAPATTGATNIAWKLAKGFHGKIEGLHPVVRLFNAAKVMSVLGKDGDTPSKLLLCYSDNNVNSKAAIKYPASDFIGYMYKIAEECNIPIFNLKMTSCLEDLNKFIDTME